MSWNWISSSHPISDIRDWSNTQRLEIRPDFQRREVWSDAAKVMLMDTILRNIPMPKLFFQAVVRNADTYRIVIDGQQRIKAILAFLHDGFVLGEPYSGQFLNYKFSALPQTIQEEFLSYRIDVNEIRNASDDIVRDIYSRVNKYTFALNKQELRRADYPGEFLRLSELFAEENFFEDARIFTLANSKRMGDVEYVSELLASLLSGPQEKKETLDAFYQRFAEWESADKDAVSTRFRSILADLNQIFDPIAFPLSKSRFRQKADFYSLFAAINDCHLAGGILNAHSLDLLREDLRFLNENIEPQSRAKLLSEYAVKCVSQGNTLGSRTWRRDFLKFFLHSGYFHAPPPQNGIEYFRDILLDGYQEQDMCPAQELTCPVCNRDYRDYFSKDNAFLTWPITSLGYQLQNAVFVHRACKEAARTGFFVWDDEVARNSDDTPNQNV
ncbi:MAG: DUF262 domain-containing protein [bacterium]